MSADPSVHPCAPCRSVQVTGLHVAAIRSHGEQDERTERLEHRAERQARVRLRPPEAEPHGGTEEGQREQADGGEGRNVEFGSCGRQSNRRSGRRGHSPVGLPDP